MKRARLIGVVGCASAILVCEALVFRYLFQYGISNVSAIDGASQQFPAYLYLHEWASALLGGRAAGYGQWSWRLGLGSDVLTALSWHLADPFALVGLLFPARLLEYVHEALYFLRVLCAGLAAYAYFRTMKAARFASTAGALVYVFSTFLTDLTIRQPFFVNPMVWLPLVLIGIERALARRRWYLLVGALAVAAASDYYFFYKIVLFAAIYAVARWAETTPSGDRLRRLVADGSRMFGLFVLGLALAAWMLVPAALAVFASSRSNPRYALPLFYAAKDYVTYVVALVSAVRGAHSFEGGFAVLGVLAVAVLLLRRGHTALKVMLGASAAILVLPALGWLANGFNLPSYRFTFVVGLFIGAAVAILLSDRSPLSRRELTVAGIAFAVFAVADIWACVRLGRPLLLVAVPLGIGALTWALFAVERGLGRSVAPADETPSSSLPRRPSALRLGVVVLVVAGIAANGVLSFSRRYSSALDSFLPIGTVYSRYANDPGALAPSLPTSGLQRIDKQMGVLGSDLGPVQSNDPLAQGFAGLDYYYSVMAGGMHEYPKGLADRSKRGPSDFEGFDDRAALDTLNGVRYYIAPTEGTTYVPYGFVPVSALGTQTVYQNGYGLPVGYVYHSVVAPGSYEALAPVDKQQALLQAVVLEDGEATGVARIKPQLETIEVTYTLEPSTRLSWDQATREIVVRKRRASATLAFSPVRDAELYVQMEGVTFEGPSLITVSAAAAGPPKAHWFMAPSRDYYWGDHTLLVNLGYYRDGTSRATLGFLEKAKVHYTSLKVIAVPMTRYGDRVRRLAAEGMRDVRVGTDALSGTVASHGAGVLFLSVPFSEGWSATVDGAPARIIPANVGFSALPVASGTHRVELRYRTPGLLLGTWVSLLALALASALGVRRELGLAAARKADRPTSGSSTCGGSTS